MGVKNAITTVIIGLALAVTAVPSSAFASAKVPSQASSVALWVPCYIQMEVDLAEGQDGAGMAQGAYLTPIYEPTAPVEDVNASDLIGPAVKVIKVSPPWVLISVPESDAAEILSAAMDGNIFWTASAPFAKQGQTRQATSTDSNGID